MAFLSASELEAVGFRRLGKGVKISSKASIYDAGQIEIGDNARIDDFCVISGRVTIGRNVHIAVFCNVAGGVEGVTLEDFSGLAYGVQVFSQSDDYTGASLTNPTVPAKYKRETKRKVHIGRHCIIGTSSLVFPGVTMAEGSSLGAMSMLTKATEPWSVYFGVPARKIRNRSKALLDLEQAYLAEEAKGPGGP